MRSLVFATLLTAITMAPHTPLRAEESLSVPDSAWEVRPLLPGMQAPAFELTNADGSRYRFEQGNQAKPRVITFYRGGWCPYCSAYLGSLRLAEQELDELGFEIVFISADQVDVLKPGLEDKTQSGFHYTLLSDNDLIAARAFGVAFRLDDELFSKYVNDFGHDLEGASGRTHHMLSVPATFVIDRKGVIQFSYVNPDYRVRLHPDVLVAAARAAAAGSFRVKR